MMHVFEESDIDLIKKVMKRLYLGDKFKTDEMRDNAQLLEAFLDKAVDLNEDEYSEYLKYSNPTPKPFHQKTAFELEQDYLASKLTLPEFVKNLKLIMEKFNPDWSEDLLEFRVSEVVNRMFKKYKLEK